MSIEQFGKNYVEKYSKYEKERDQIEQEVKTKKEELKQLEQKYHEVWNSSPSWIDEIIKPIAEEMLKDARLYGFTYGLYGPFGLSAETSIHFNKADTETLLIEFLPNDLDHGKLTLRDYLTDTHSYREGSIAEMNGANHPNVPMKETIKELVDWTFDLKRRSDEAFDKKQKEKKENV